MLGIHLKTNRKTSGELFNYLILNGYQVRVDNYGDNIYSSAAQFAKVLRLLNERKIEYSIF